MSIKQQSMVDILTGSWWHTVHSLFWISPMLMGALHRCVWWHSHLAQSVAIVWMDTKTVHENKESTKNLNIIRNTDPRSSDHRSTTDLITSTQSSFTVYIHVGSFSADVRFRNAWSILKRSTLILPIWGCANSHMMPNGCEYIFRCDLGMCKSHEFLFKYLYNWIVAGTNNGNIHIPLSENWSKYCTHG